MLVVAASTLCCQVTVNSARLQDRELSRDLHSRLLHVPHAQKQASRIQSRVCVLFNGGKHDSFAVTAKIVTHFAVWHGSVSPHAHTGNTVTKLGKEDLD